MKCYANRDGTKLLNIPSTAQVVVTTDGTPYRILPEQADNQTDASQDYKFVSNMNVAGGAGSPTALLLIQGSTDGATWIDLAPGTTRVAPGNFREIIDQPNAGLLPWVRCRLVLAGTTPPSVDAMVETVSTAAFQLAPK